MIEFFTLYKLIILYMLRKIDFPLTNSQISDFFLNKGYTSYFKLQQSISELLEANLIREEVVHNRTLYHLTEEGSQSIQYFQNKIAPSIKEDIDDFLMEHKFKLKNEVSVKANYHLNTNQEYVVQCQVIEGDVPLIDLTVTTATEASAVEIIQNWTKKNQEIYAMIMEQLL